MSLRDAKVQVWESIRRVKVESQTRLSLGKASMTDGLVTTRQLSSRSQLEVMTSHAGQTRDMLQVLTLNSRHYEAVLVIIHQDAADDEAVGQWYA